MLEEKILEAVMLKGEMLCVDMLKYIMLVERMFEENDDEVVVAEINGTMIKREEVKCRLLR